MQCTLLSLCQRHVSRDHARVLCTLGVSHTAPHTPQPKVHPQSVCGTRSNQRDNRLTLSQAGTQKRLQDTVCTTQRSPDPCSNKPVPAAQPSHCESWQAVAAAGTEAATAAAAAARTAAAAAAARAAERAAAAVICPETLASGTTATEARAVEQPAEEQAAATAITIRV